LDREPLGRPLVRWTRQGWGVGGPSRCLHAGERPRRGPDRRAPPRRRGCSAAGL